MPVACIRSGANLLELRAGGLPVGERRVLMQRSLETMVRDGWTFPDERFDLSSAHSLWPSMNKTEKADQIRF